MKISGIDKDFVDIIYYLDSKGFKPFASCDGVWANHENPNEVGDAYISFLKSPRIIELMAEFLKDGENFDVMLKSDSHEGPYELYGNIISGTTYNVYFSNKNGEKTDHFKNIIKKTVEKEHSVPSDEKKNLEILEKVLEENSDSDLTFKVSFNKRYNPYIKDNRKINSLTITPKTEEGKIEGNIIIKDIRDMEVLADILSKEYGISQIPHNEDKHEETKYIELGFDKTSCTIYFLEEHFPEILEMIHHVKKIAHTLPTFESKEWIGSDEELFEDIYSEDWMIDEESFEEGQQASEQENTPLKQRERKLAELEKEAEQLSKKEREMSKLNKERTNE